MGNETSLLKKCTIPSKPKCTTSEWSLFDATYQNQYFSIFIFNETNLYSDILRWKHIRHPNLVKCYESGELRGKKYILTEPLIPICEILDKSHLYSKLYGLFHIGEALSFLHQVCGISVNNLTIDSIFISKSDTNEIWKLGSLYWSSSIDSESEEFFKHLIGFHTSHGSLSTLPPEDREMRTHRLIRSSREIYRRDSYAFVRLTGQLLYDTTNPPKLSDMILASENVISNFSLHVKTFVDTFNSLPDTERVSITELLNHSLFADCTFVQIRQFFSNFSTVSDYEKCKFFESFIDLLRSLPDQMLLVNVFTTIVSSRLIMSNNVIYCHIMPYFLIPEFQIDKDEKEDESKEKIYTLTNGQTVRLKPLIESNIYRECIIPHIANLYCVHDLKIRSILLQYLPHYGLLIPKTCLRKVILPQILLGIKDSNSELVSLTFRAVAVLIDLFGVVTVLGGSKRFKYFVDGVSRKSESSDDTHDNSLSVSVKSLSTTSLNTSYKFNHSIILERSSPDGGETTHDTISRKESNTLAKTNSLNVTEEECENDWPDWSDPSPGHSIYSESKKANQVVNDLIEKRLPRKSHVTTFDIKAIDFNEVECNEEIDNLFLDMQPVLKFSHHLMKEDLKNTTLSDQLLTKGVENCKSLVELSEDRMSNLNLFEPEEVNEDELKSSAWNDSIDWDINEFDLDSAKPSTPL